MTAEPSVFAAPSTVRLLVGDVRAGLATLEPESIQTCVTSVPYWGLRSYGTVPQVWGQTCCEHPHEWGAQKRAPWANEVPGPNTGGKNGARIVTKLAGQFCGHVHEWAAIVKPAANGIVNSAMQGVTLSGQSATRSPSTSGRCDCGAWLGELGNEPTPDLYVEHIVEVFRHVWRVLRKDATLWLNIGFSYAGSGKGPTGHNGIGDQSERQGFTGGVQRIGPQEHTIGSGRVPGYKPKDLIPIPWLVAIALQQDGWYWRSTIAWCKKATMPEAVTDRPTSAWEPILLMTKSRRYFYDKNAVAESTAGSDTHSRGNGVNPKAKVPSGWDTGPGGHRELVGRYRHKQNESFSAAVNEVLPTRNMRNTWLLGPEPFSGAHFAVFPTEVPRRCIQAGTSEQGQCPECGAPWGRITEQGTVNRSNAALAGSTITGKGHPTDQVRPEHDVRNGPTSVAKTVGWRATCAHSEAAPVPQTVLDPFGGAMTTAMVAARLGREAVAIELKPEYARMGAQRIRDDGGFTVDVSIENLEVAAT